MIGIILLIVLLPEIFKVDLIKTKECVTPYNYENATCVQTSSCDVISSLLFTLTPRAIQFYKDSLWGCESGMVCCGTSNYPELINYIPLLQPQNILPLPVSDNSVCGLDTTTYRIKGGSIVKAEELPWVAALEYKNRLTNENAGIHCGGSLITERFVLTAAHCVLDMEFELIKVWLGVSNITSEETCSYHNSVLKCVKSVQKVNVVETIPHELYDSIEKFNDIALLKLDANIKFSDYIRPICIPSAYSELPSIGSFLTVAGWGVTEDGKPSEIKRKVQVPLRDNQLCQDYLRKRYRTITSKQLCVGGERGKDSCEGDSGGPLVYDFVGANDDVQWYQHGIVSYGTACGLQGRPGVYVKVSSYTNWIWNKIRNKRSRFEQDEPCTTHNGTIGTCALLSTCHESLKIVLTKSEYYRNQKLLQKIQCNISSGKYALFCCESARLSNDVNTASAVLPNKTTCGIVKEKRGIQDDVANFPWMAGIEVSYGQDNITKIRCIGTIIHHRYVLTTAQCIFGEENETFQPINVWFGSWNSSRDNGNPVQKIEIKKIIPYPLSTVLAYSNNALLLLEHKITFSDYISPICLSSPNIPKLKSLEIVTRLVKSSRTEFITSSDFILKEELQVNRCHEGGLKSNPGDDSPNTCLFYKNWRNCDGMVPNGAPLMVPYRDLQSEKIHWYLLSMIDAQDSCDTYVLNYSNIINDCLDWIKIIISEYS